jgi:hypothetical protein
MINISFQEIQDFVNRLCSVTTTEITTYTYSRSTPPVYFVIRIDQLTWSVKIKRNYIFPTDGNDLCCQISEDNVRRFWSDIYGAIAELINIDYVEIDF